MTNEEIKAWCKSNNITQAQLSQKIGYSAGTLAQVLNDLREMKPRMLEAIKRVMEEHERPCINAPQGADMQAIIESLEETQETLRAAQERLASIAQKLK